MIVFDESEYLESDFSEVTLKFMQDIYGPRIKDMLLLPGTVVINVPLNDQP